MNSNNTEVITLLIAIWGSITGTLSLVLRYIDSYKDRPILMPLAEFDFSDYYQPPPKITMTLEIVNVGHRQITLDSFLAIYKPSNLIKRFIWKIYGYGTLKITPNEMITKDSLLQEGQSKVFTFNSDEIFPNDEYDPLLIKAIIVRDKAGNEWASKGVKSQSLISDFRENALIQTDNLSDETRSFTINHYKIGKLQLITIQRISYGSKKHHHQWFRFLDDAKTYYEKMINEGKEFLTGTIITLSFEEDS